MAAITVFNDLNIDDAFTPQFVAVSNNSSTASYTPDVYNTAWTAVATIGNIVNNGTFATDTSGWTLGGGGGNPDWYYSASTVAHANGGGTAVLQPNPPLAVVAGNTYEITFTTTRTAGSVTVGIGGANGTTRSTANTFTETLTAVNTGNLIFTPTTTFVGSVDTVIVRLQNWNSVCYGNKQIVAVAKGSRTIVTSPNGSTWTDRVDALPSTENWQSIIYGNGTFIAIANGTNPTATSIDGITWGSGGVMPSTDQWYCLAYGAPGGTPTFVAVSNNNSTAAASSVNNGSSWQSRTLPAAKNWRSVCYGNGQFIAVSYGTTDVAVSTDGFTWNAAGSMPNARNWASVEWGNPNNTANGIFVAVAYGTGIGAISIDNGVSWSEVYITPNMVINGNFDGSAYGWALTAGWSYGSNKITHTSGGGVTTVTPTPAFAAVANYVYEVVFTVSGCSTGTITAAIGGTSGTARGADGTYSQQLTSGGVTTLTFTPTTDFNGSIDTISVRIVGNWNCISYGEILSASGLGVKVFTVTGFTTIPTAISLDGLNWSTKTISSNAGWAYHCFAPIAWNSGDTLDIKNNATVTVNTDQTKFWKTITGTYGTLRIENTSESVGKSFYMGKAVTLATANAITVQSGLFSIDIDGRWKSLGTGNNTANQTFTLPFQEYVPSIEVETAVAGVYEVWNNVTGAWGPYMKLFGKDGLEWCGNGKKGNYFVQLPAPNPVSIVTATGGINTIQSYYITFSNITRSTITSSATRVLTFAIDGTIVQSGAGAVNWATDNYAVGDILTIFGGLNAGTFTVKAINTLTLTVNETLQAQVANNNPVVTINGVFPPIYSGAQITGTSIPADTVINRVVGTIAGVTTLELNAVCTASNTAQTYTIYNPLRAQLTSTIMVGDGTNGNVIPAGRDVRCATQMISDASPSNRVTADSGYECYIDMGLAAPISAQVCLFGLSYVYLNQPASVYFRHVGFAYQFYLNECYAVDMDYVGIAASPPYWYYNAKWICRDQRYGTIAPIGYTVPTKSINATFLYIHYAKIKNFHKVVYCTGPITGTVVYPIDLSYTNDSTWENIRIVALNNMRITFALYLTTKCYRNTFTNLEVYGLIPINLVNSDNNTLSGCEYALSLEKATKSFSGAMRIGYDPATGNALVDGTTYYFKVRSFRSWMDRSQYYDSNEYSATAFQGDWQFPDYLSIKPTETNPRSVTMDWVRRDPTNATIAYEIYRGNSSDFTDRSPASRVFASPTVGTITAVLGSKYSITTSTTRILTFSASAKTIVQSGAGATNWATEGYVIGDTIYIYGSYGGNNGTFTVTNIVTTTLTVSETLYDEVTSAGPAPVISVLRITSKSSSTRAYTFATGKTITVGAGQSWIGVDGFAVGDVIDISGAVAPLNNGTFTVNTASATVLTVNEPLAAEVTPTSTSAAVTRIFTFASAGSTLTVTGSTPGSFITDGHVIGDTVYVANSVSNPGPFVITNLTATVMTVTGTVTNETCPAGTIVYRRVTITLRAPVAGQRYWYRFRKYHFTQALTGCSAPGFFITTNRAVTGGNTVTLTTSVAHGFIVGQSVTVTGLMDTTYRGTFTIATVPSTTTFTYALTHGNESVADTTGKIIMANITSTFRACNNNVVTVTTATAHKLVVNQSVVITGLGGGDNTYNGTFTITTVGSTTTFSYSLSHGNENSTADNGGVIKNISLFAADMTTTRTVASGPAQSSSGGRSFVFSASLHTIVCGSGSWVTDGYIIDDIVTISGSLAGNNGTFTITYVTATTLTIAETIYDETGNASPVITITGKNVATITTTIAHALIQSQTVNITGIVDSAYNGTYNIRTVPSGTTFTYQIDRATEGSTADNAGRVANQTINFDYAYYLAGFKFDLGAIRITNLINNIYSSMFKPGITITGQGIPAATTVVSIDPSGREMIISNPTTTSTSSIFAVTYSTTRRTVTSNVATLYTSVAHNMTIGYIVFITGMSDATYNGTYTITAIPSSTTFRYALTHADEVITPDTTGTVTINSITLNIPAQSGLVAYNLGGIPIGTEVASVQTSSILRLTALPDIAIAYASCSFMTYAESAPLTSIANYYTTGTNFCLQSRTLGTTWTTSNITVGTNATYILPTVNDWTTVTAESLTASADNGTLSQSVSGLCPNTTYTASIWVRADQTATIPFGVAGRLSWGTTNTDFIATNKYQLISATATTGAGVTSLNFVIRVNTNTQVIFAGDAMVNLGATPQSHITTTATSLQLAPAATAIGQLRTWCRPQAFCGSTGNQGIEINTFGTAPTDTYYSEVYMSTTPGFSPSEANKIASTIAVDNPHFGLSGSNGNIFSNITKLYGGGSAAAASGIIYLTAFCERNVFKDINIDLEYCNSSTLPILYLNTAVHNNVFHNINLGRGKNYLSSNIIYTQSTNALIGNRFQNIKATHYDMPIANVMLDTKIKGMASARAVPLPTGVYPYVLGGTSDGVAAAAATYQASYGSQFSELYNSATEGILNIVCEDTKGATKPYTIKAGLPTFSNKGQIELKSANSVITVSRSRAGNVATIVTALPHKILNGDEIIVAGLGGTGYNGTQTVTSVPSTTSFTYANSGSAEGVTADTDGTITVGDSIEYVWPHRIYGVSGFRKLYPKMLGLDLGTYADFLEGVKVEVSIKTANSWSNYVRATPDNLSAISVNASTGFYFKFKLTAMPFMKYGTRTNNFIPGEIVEGGTSFVSAKVEEVYDNGLTGTIVLSRMTGTFFPLELIRRQSDDQSRATNVATNTFAMGPSFTSYVWIVQFFTTIDQSVLYPYDAVDLVLNQLLSGSTVGIFDDTTTLLQSGTSTSVYTYTYGWYGTTHQYSYRVRKAGYVEIDVNWNTQSSTLTIPVFQTQYRAVEDASGYTGISINGAAKTITVTTNHTHLELYDYAQYWSCLEANIIYQVPLTISVDSKTIIVTSGWIVTVAGASLTDTTRNISGTVIYTSGGSYQDTNEADWESGGVLYYASTFSHTISDGTNPIIGAEITYYDGTNTNRTYNTSKNLVTSLSSDGSGVASGYVVYKNDVTTYSGHYVKVRQYGFLTSSGTRTVNGFPIVDTITLTTDNFVTHTEAAVSAFSGINVDYGTKTITVTSNHTLTEIYEYLKYSNSLSANMDKPDTIATSDGTNYLLTADWGIDINNGITVTATGKKLVMSGSGTYNLHSTGQFIGTMADATKTRVPVTLNGIVVGSRCRIEVTGDHSTIYNDEPATSSITTYFEHITDTPITIIVRKSSASTKYLDYITGSTITSTGASVSIAQIPDTIVLENYGSISSDWTVDVSTKTIKHTNGTTVYSVTELYSWLQDYFDELTYLSYLVPMSAQTPTEFNLINGWFINDLSINYLTGGAITSNGQNNEIYLLTFSSTGYISAINTDIGKSVHNSGSTHTGNLLDFNNTTRQWWIRKVTGVFTAEGITISSGTGAGTTTTVETGESIWSNIFTLGSLVPNTTLDVYQNDLQLSPWWGTGHIDILVKVKQSGTKIDNSYLTVLARTYKSLYDHFIIDASSGRNPIPLAAFSDSNNQTDSGIVAAYSGFAPESFVFGYATKDMGNGNNSQPYDCVIDCHNHTIIEIYQYLKYVTRSGSTTILNGVEGEFYTGVGDVRFDYDNLVNSFVEGQLISGSGSVRGYLVSLTGTTMVLRNVHGTFTNNMAISSVTATALVNGTVTVISPQKQAPFGSFAGGKFFGARGVFLDNVYASDSNNYQLIDALGVTQAPPSFISVVVSGLEAGDVVSVFRTTGNNKIIDKTYLHSHASNNSSATSTWETDVSTPIPTDTPASGFIRLVKTTTNVEERIAYSSWEGNIFTLSSPHSGGYSGSDTAYVPFIDTTTASNSESASFNFATNRYIYSIVRHKGIVPFDVKGQITSTGYSLTAIRTTDSIVAP